LGLREPDSGTVLETVPDYPTDEQVAGFNHLYVEPFVPFKKEKPYQGEELDEKS